MKKLTLVLSLLIGFSTLFAQEEGEINNLKQSEFIININAQVGAHNYNGWKTPLTGIGAYFGYSYFWNAHRLTGGIEIAARGGTQVLLIPDYHYEWIVGRLRTALGMKVMGGYWFNKSGNNIGFAAGAQPSFEIGLFVLRNFSITLSTGYRMMYYPQSKVAEGKLIFEIPIELNIRF